jgi:hypothetical protein
MIDVHKKVRKAYYEALNGQLTYDGSPVSVWDEKAEATTNNIYVLLSTQTATDTSTFSSFDTQTTILIDIVSKSQDRVSKDVLDEVAQQILTIILPTVTTNGLPAQSGVQILNVRKESDNYLPVQLSATGSIIRRLIRFSQRVHEL